MNDLDKKLRESIKKELNKTAQTEGPSANTPFEKILASVESASLMVVDAEMGSYSAIKGIGSELDNIKRNIAILKKL